MLAAWDPQCEERSPSRYFLVTLGNGPLGACRCEFNVFSLLQNLQNLHFK